MNKNIISDFIKMKGIQTETKIKSWSAVDIDFMNDNKVTEETSFDVKNVKMSIKSLSYETMKNELINFDRMMILKFRNLKEI